MIAKASTISHGANAIRYFVNKEKADIVKSNLLPDNISPEAIYGRMILVQKKFAKNINKGRPLGRNMIRIELSPSEEESRDWIQSEEIGIHHKQEISDSCMGILRTMDKFSWQQYEIELMKRGYKVHLQEKGGGGVYGYSIKRGNSIYKSSVLGVGRNLTPSKIEATWAKLHPQERKSEPTKPTSRQTRTADITLVIPLPTTPQPVMKHYDIMTDEYHKFHVEIPEAADSIIQQDGSLEEAHPLTKIEEIQHTALLLFAGYLDAATSMAASSGGGGSDTGGWGRDKDEDELE